MVFLFYLLLTVTIVLIIFIFSEVKIQILNMQYNYMSIKPDIFMNTKKSKINKLEYLIQINIYIFGKIPVIKFKINKETIKKLEKRKSFIKFENKLKKRINTIEVKIIENINNTKKNIVSNIIEFVKNIKIQISQINLDMKIGFEDIIITTFLIPLLSTSLSFIINKTVKNKEKSSYKIMPIYNLNNINNKIDISFKGIFKIKMTHIINLIYIMKNKEKNNLKITKEKLSEYSYK